MGAYTQLWTDLELDVERHEELLAFESSKYREIILSQRDRPAGMAYFDNAIRAMHGRRVQEIVEARSGGAKMVGTFCIYVPEEIVLAAGAIPVALCGGTAFSIPYAERVFPRDICPLVKSTLGLAYADICPYAPIKDLGVGETTCDAKKKTWDVIGQKPDFHVLELPQKKNKLDLGLWVHEVRAFKGRVEELTGNTVTAEKLQAGIRLMNRKRRLLQELSELRWLPLPAISGKDALVVMQVALTDEPRRFCKALEAMLRELRKRSKAGISPFPAHAPRILLAGCPSVAGNWKMHHIIETSGAAVVCDESCTGTRYFEHLADETGRTADELLAALAERYFRIDCACFSPNNERIEHIVELAHACGADAVIQYTLQYCHGYNIEAIRVARALQAAAVPSLAIETDYSEEDSGQIRTRVEALLESIRDNT